MNILKAFRKLLTKQKHNTSGNKCNTFE